MEELCTSCLCSGRKLCSIFNTKVYDLYTRILNEIPQYTMSHQVSVNICWECHSVLHKYLTFKHQAQSSYVELLRHINQATTPTEKEPRLTTHHIIKLSCPEIKLEPLLDEEDTSKVNIYSQNYVFKYNLGGDEAMDVQDGDTEKTLLNIKEENVNSLESLNSMNPNTCADIKNDCAYNSGCEETLDNSEGTFVNACREDRDSKQKKIEENDIDIVLSEGEGEDVQNEKEVERTAPSYSPLTSPSARRSPDVYPERLNSTSPSRSRSPHIYPDSVLEVVFDQDDAEVERSVQNVFFLAPDAYAGPGVSDSRPSRVRGSGRSRASRRASGRASGCSVRGHPGQVRGSARNQRGGPAHCPTDRALSRRFTRPTKPIDTPFRTHWPVRVPQTPKDVEANRKASKRCVVCLDEGRKEIKAQFQCETCLAPLCIDRCFKKYHERK